MDNQLKVEFEGREYKFKAYRKPAVGDVFITDFGKVMRADSNVYGVDGPRLVLAGVLPKPDPQKALVVFKDKAYQAVAYRCPKAGDQYLYISTANFDFLEDKHCILQEVEP